MSTKDRDYPASQYFAAHILREQPRIKRRRRRRPTPDERTSPRLLASLFEKTGFEAPTLAPAPAVKPDPEEEVLFDDPTVPTEDEQ